MLIVPAPIKDAASIQKSFFQFCTMVDFAEFHIFLLNVIAIIGNFLGATTFQERPL